MGLNTDLPSTKTLCDRCGNQVISITMSMFNEDIICPACKSKETNHPDYKKAAEAELEAVQAGDLNFPGIGKPADL